MRHHGTDCGHFDGIVVWYYYVLLDHGVETIHFETQFWPILGDPEGVGQRIFWSQGAPQRHLWPGIRFWTPRELTPETTLSSRGDLCLMGRQTNTRKWCCSIRALSNKQWGYNQQRLGKSGAKCSRRSMQLTKFPFPNSWSNDVKGYHRCDVILLRAQVEG